eukprot:scaffold7.g3742.t1
MRSALAQAPAGVGVCQEGVKRDVPMLQQPGARRRCRRGRLRGVQRAPCPPAARTAGKRPPPVALAQAAVAAAQLIAQEGEAARDAVSEWASAAFRQRRTAGSPAARQPLARAMQLAGTLAGAGALAAAQLGDMLAILERKRMSPEPCDTVALAMLLVGARGGAGTSPGAANGSAHRVRLPAWWEAVEELSANLKLPADERRALRELSWLHKADWDVDVAARAVRLDAEKRAQGEAGGAESLAPAATRAEAKGAGASEAAAARAEAESARAREAAQAAARAEAEAAAAARAEAESARAREAAEVAARAEVAAARAEASARAEQAPAAARAEARALAKGVRAREAAEAAAVRLNELQAQLQALEEAVRQAAARRAQEEEAARRTAARRAQEEEAVRQAAARRAQEEEAVRQAAARRAQEEEAARQAAARRAQEEEAVRQAAARRAQEEEAGRDARLVAGIAANEAAAAAQQREREELPAAAARRAVEQVIRHGGPDWRPLSSAMGDLLPELPRMPHELGATVTQQKRPGARGNRGPGRKAGPPAGAAGAAAPALAPGQQERQQQEGGPGHLGFAGNLPLHLQSALFPQAVEW